MLSVCCGPDTASPLNGIEKTSPGITALASSTATENQQSGGKTTQSGFTKADALTLGSELLSPLR